MDIIIAKWQFDTKQTENSASAKYCLRYSGNRTACPSVEKQRQIDFTGKNLGLSKRDSRDKGIRGAAGNAPTTSEWSTIVLSTKVRLILETWR